MAPPALVDAYGRSLSWTPRDVVVRDREGRILFACAVGAFVNGQAEILGPFPIFANSTEDAREQLAGQLLRRGIRDWTEVAIGPAVGFFAHDDHGDSASFSIRNQSGHIARTI